MDEDQEELEIINNSPKGHLIKEIDQRCKKSKLEIDGFLSQVLDNLLASNRNQETYLKNGIVRVNFAEEALMLQACGRLYAKNVDSLWDGLLVIQKDIFQHEQQMIMKSGSVDPNVLEQHKIETLKLEERLNRGKRKKIKLSVIDNVRKLDYANEIKKAKMQMLQLFHVKKREDLNEYTKPKVVFETNNKLLDRWRIEANREEEKENSAYDSVVVSEFNTQDLRYKPYPCDNGDEIIYDLSKPTQVNTTKRFLIGHNFIRHFIDLNDRCILPDNDSFVIAKLRISLYHRSKWMLNHNLDADVPYEKYREEYEKFESDVFANEKRKIQNMPQGTTKEVLRFYEALKLKEKRANQVWARRDWVGRKYFTDVTFQTLVVDPLKEDYDGLFDPYIPDEFLDPEPEEDGSISKESAERPNSKLRPDSGIGETLEEEDDTTETDTEAIETNDANNSQETTANIPEPDILASSTPSIEAAISDHHDTDNGSEETVPTNETDSKKSTRNIHAEESNGMLIVLYQKNKFLKPKVKSKYVAMETVVYKDRKTKDYKERLSLINFEQANKKRVQKEVTESDTSEPKKRKVDGDSDKNVEATAETETSEALTQEMSQGTDDADKTAITTPDKSANGTQDIRDSGIFDQNEFSEIINASNPTDSDSAPLAEPSLTSTPTEPPFTSTQIESSGSENQDSGIGTLNVSREETASEKKVRKLREEVDNYLEQKMEEMTVTVQEWKRYLTPKLKNLNDQDFDINEYCSNIVNVMNVEEEKPFSAFVSGKPVAEVVRYFVSTLQLANMMNVEIKGARPGEISNDTFHLKLLTVESSYQKNLNTYRPDTIHERMNRFTSSVVNNSENEPSTQPHQFQVPQHQPPRQYTSPQRKQRKHPGNSAAVVLNMNLNLSQANLLSQRHHNLLNLDERNHTNLTNRLTGNNNKRPNSSAVEGTVIKRRILQNTYGSADRQQSGNNTALPGQALLSPVSARLPNIYSWRCSAFVRDQQEIDYQQPSTSSQAMI